MSTRARNVIHTIALSSLLVAFACASPTPAQEDLADIVHERVVNVRRSVAIAVGVAEPTSRRFITEGHLEAGGDAEIDEGAIFEIGSLTKIFTAVLLADMAAHGEVALDDPISKYLPADVVLPDGAGDRITLLHLATHTAGFPRNPPNAAAVDDHGVLARYSADQLYDYLRDFHGETAPGEEYAYSNVGMGLLGHILSLRAGRTYGALLQERIFAPLGMSDTHIAGAEERPNRFAEPHNAAGDTIGRWEFDVLAGAGAIRSSIRDMLKFASVAAGVEDGPGIAAAIRSTYTRKYPIPGGDAQYYLGWIFPSEAHGGYEIFWHDGGTGGSRSFLGVVNTPERRMAAVVLSNTALSVNDIGLHALDPDWPLRSLERLQQIDLPAQALTPFLGAYRLSDEETIIVSEREGRLYVQVTGDNEYPVYPYQPAAFFYRVADAQLLFSRDENGVVVSVTLRAEGHDRTAAKLN